MTMPEQDAPRKPPKRFWLLAPYALLAVALLGWSAGWWTLKSRIEAGMDEQAADLRAAGYEAAWKSRTVSGYPFRLMITLTEARVREPSGWALDVPLLKAEANAFNIDHWVLVATDGAVVTRPLAGGLKITGKGLRASMVRTDADLPRIAVQGAGLIFTPEPGARAFALTRADKLEFHLVPGGKNEAAILLRIDGGHASPGGLTARLAGDRPVSLLWDSLISQRDALKGQDWPQSVRAWTAAGGAMTLRQGGLTLGDTVLGVKSGQLTTGVDGRLRGGLQVSLTRAEQTLQAMGDSGLIEPVAAQIASAVMQARSDGKAAQANITFEAGRTTLGPVAVGPAPRVY